MTKVRIEVGNGIEVTFPMRERYTAPEFITFASSLAKGLNAIHNKFESVEALSGGGSNPTKKSKYDFKAIQKQIDKTKMTYQEIEEDNNMSKNTIYRCFKQGKLKKRATNGKN